MSHDIRQPAMGADHLGQIGGEVGVAVGGHMRAVAVVAHVDGHNLAAVGQAAGNDAPVPARAVEAVGDDQGGGLGCTGGRVSDRGEHGNFHSDIARLWPERLNIGAKVTRVGRRFWRGLE